MTYVLFHDQFFKKEISYYTFDKCHCQQTTHYNTSDLEYLKTILLKHYFGFILGYLFLKEQI